MGGATKNRGKKIRAYTLLLTFSFYLLAPYESFALTAGPTSPEFSTFVPVTTTDMVNVFSGDFSYNLPVIEIPGPDGAGYGLSLSYQSGASAEQEASWVGFGWILNPGSINRSVRGFPDDYNDTEVVQYKKTRPNWSYSATHAIGNIEIFGADLPLSFNESHTYNNYSGYSKYVGLGISIKGMAGLNMNFGDDGELTFSPYVNPLAIFKNIFSSTKETDDSKDNSNSTKNEKHGYEQVKKEHSAMVKKSLESKFSGSLAKITSTYGLFTHSEVVRAASVERYSGDAWNWTTSIMQVNPSQAPVGAEFSISGNLNIQANIPRQKFQSFGYVNTPGLSGDNHQLSDHYYENDSPYSKRDYNLGIPFNNHDQYVVTGEGLGGSFRYFTKNTGHYYPNFTQSTSQIKSGGVEFMLGTNVGIGLDIGFGEQVFSSTNWSKEGNTGNYQFDSTNDGFFRFTGDKGGKVEYSTSSAAQSATVSSSSNFPGAKKGKPTIAPSIETEIQVTGSSSHIASTTVGDIRSDASLRLNKNVNISETNSYINDPNLIENEETILEFQTVNEGGMHYTYGLPVFNSNDLNLQVSLENELRDCRNNTGTTDKNCVENNHLAFQDLSFSTYDGNIKEPNLDNYETVTGEFRKEPYVKNYLLTNITDHNFIDINEDGPGPEDFGAWTNFHYFQKHNILNSSYHWRSPYMGLQYLKNSISDPGDDLGGLLAGDKDVYYLKAIETKTHIAFFVTNKSNRARYDSTFDNIALPSAIDSYITGGQQPRLDGLGAPRISGSVDPAANSSDKKANSQRLEYLEKIVLFSKNRLNKPLKTVHFQYDYSLVKNLPNNSKGRYPGTNVNADSGKLTLKKVWFEYEGTHRTRISPYQFEYNYKVYPEELNFLKSNFGELGEAIFEHANAFGASAQNPNYEPYLLDAWGNVQPRARERHRDMNPWLYQGVIDESYDPAAWQLKQIKLPSGGEIHVQYEEKDYRYVQDKPAMSMVSINQMISEEEYLLNLEDIGVNTSIRQEVQDVADEIKKYYGGNGENEKMFFKFLYSFSNGPPSIGLNSCNAEYITGYAQLSNVQVLPDPSDNSKWTIEITLDSNNSTNGDRTTLPKQACFDFYKSQRDGWNTNDCSYDRNLDLGLNIASLGDKIESKAESSAPFTDIETNLADFGLFFDLFGLEAITSIVDIGANIETVVNAVTVCNNINPDLSYLKIPMTKPKRGGGVRVKRLLMFDLGMEQGDATIYGSEYSYTNEDGKSSGVATNEPVNFAEENALVSFLPRKGQSWFSRLTAGLDKKQTQGPLGRTNLPSPAVGHSRVEIKNIHSGITGSGKVVHEFYTAKDFPFDKYFDGANDIEAGKGALGTNLSDNEVNDFMLIPAGLFNFEVNNAFLGQGFRFISTDMHGQVKRVSTFGETNNDNYYLTAMREYEYYRPGEKVLILNPDNTFAYDIPGKEEDITMGMRQLSNNTTDISIELDVSVGLMFPPPIFITPIPSVSLSEKDISTHVTSKVIKYPSIVKSVKNYQDGTYTQTDYLGFDKYTGSSILTRTIDGFDKLVIGGGDEGHDGAIYKLELPASYKYARLRPIFDPSQSGFANPLNTNRLGEKTATFVTYGQNGFNLNTTNNTWSMGDYLDVIIQTYANGNRVSSWFDDQIRTTYNIPTANAVLGKLRAIYRPYSTYTYKTDISSANEGTLDSKIYSAGIFNNYDEFNWNNEAVNLNNNWIRTIEISKYSPNGFPLEEKNVLELYNSVKYGDNYQHTLPTIRVDNAEYGSIGFDDFEDQVSVLAHSGLGSVLVDASSTSAMLLDNLYTSQQLKDEGGWLKLWITKFENGNSDPFTDYDNDFPDLSISINNSFSSIPLEYVARSGEWALFRVRIGANDFNALSINQMFNISLNTDMINQDIYLDDVKFQPYNSKGLCFVYDQETLKLVVQFDNQHFGLFYQYDDEGKLIRKLLETEEGIKSLQETHYHTPTKNRN